MDILQTTRILASPASKLGRNLDKADRQLGGSPVSKTIKCNILCMTQFPIVSSLKKNVNFLYKFIFNKVVYNIHFFLIKMCDCCTTPSEHMFSGTMENTKLLLMRW
jgi:hypothetical protein